MFISFKLTISCYNIVYNFKYYIVYSFNNFNRLQKRKSVCLLLPCYSSFTVTLLSVLYIQWHRFLT